MDSLKTVVNDLKTSVKPKLETSAQKQAADIISESVTKYINNSSYSLDNDVKKVKSIVAGMGDKEYENFKNAITGNILLSDLEELNDYFKFTK